MDVQDTPTHYQPAHELLKQLEAGTLTSEALITALLERIRDQNPARNARVGLWLEDPLCPVEHELTGGYRTLGNSLADRGALVNLDIDPGRSKPRSSGNTGVRPDGRKRLP